MPLPQMFVELLFLCKFEFIAGGTIGTKGCKGDTWREGWHNGGWSRKRCLGLRLGLGLGLRQGKGH